MKTKLQTLLTACMIVLIASCATTNNNVMLQRYSEFQQGGKTFSKCSAAYPTGSISTSVIRMDKIVPKQAIASQEYTYQFKVTNLQDNELKNVIITDDVPERFTLIKSSPQASISGRTARWAIPSLGPKKTVLISVTGKSASVGSISSCGTVSWDEYICATTEIVNPGLKATLSAPATASLCNVIPLVYTATNTGSIPLTNVYIDGGRTSELVALDGTRGGSMNIGSLAPGESKQIKVNAKATNVGDFTTSIRAVSDQITSKEDRTVTHVSAPVLAVSVSAPSSVIQGRPVKYDIKVVNRGSGTANAVAITSPLPAGTSLISASNGGTLSNGIISWPKTSIPTNNSVNLSVTARPVNVASMRAQATANDACAQPASDSATTSVKGVAAILLEVVDSPDPIEVGGSTTYTIRVTNQGSATDTNIKIKCMIEGTQSHISSTGSTSGSHSGGVVNFQPLAKLGPKATASWRVTVKGTKASDTRFKVSMTSDQLGRPVEETEATTIY